MAILINDNSARVKYTATSGQTVFIIPFEFFASSDVTVYRNDVEIIRDATPGSADEYSITGAGVTGGGQIQLGSPGATAGDTILIVRDVPVKRTTDFPLSGPFPIDSLNTDLDKLTVMMQDLETRLDQRSLRIGTTDDPNTLNAIPTDSVRANKLLGFDSSGQPIQSTNDLSVIDGYVSDITSGGLSVSNGGTGATSLTGYVFGNGTSAFTASSTIPGSAITGNISGSAGNVTGVVSVLNGGTGANNAADALTNLGAYPASNPDGYTTNVGTVTSVGLSGGSTGLTIFGSPITTSGSMTLAGVLNVANGGTGSSSASGARTNLSAAQSGANSDITGLSGVTGGIASPDYIDLDLTAAATSATGRLYWNNDDNAKTLMVGGAGSNVAIKVGEQTYFRVKASAAITKGEVVMFTGTVGASGGLTAAPASGITISTASYIMGVAAENIPLNGWGYITQFGLIRGINTSAFSDGDILFYDTLSTGGFTTSTPTTPAAVVEVAAVVHADLNGSIFVRPTYRFRLEELNDVPTPSVTDTYLKWNGTGYAWDTAAGASFPSYTSNGGKVLAVNAAETDVEWISVGGSGTVTSVDVSGGTTGLTFSGGPITGAGTITTAGTLIVANGGTGATTASAARVNLLPNLSGHTGEVLAVNAAGTDVEWIAAGGGSGTVTSVGLTAPVGFAVTGSPITSSGTLALAFDTGYSLPTTASQANWDTAYGWGDHASAGYLTASSTIDGGTF